MFPSLLWIDSEIDLLVVTSFTFGYYIFHLFATSFITSCHIFYSWLPNGDQVLWWYLLTFVTCTVFKLPYLACILYYIVLLVCILLTCLIWSLKFFLVVLYNVKFSYLVVWVLIVSVFLYSAKIFYLYRVKLLPFLLLYGVWNVQY